jgi:arylsulfatase
MKLSGSNVGFYGMIENIDDNVGRLMTRLKERNLENDTLLIFITDNGPSASTYNGEHKGKKGSVDEGGTRVPSFWRWPGVLTPGRDVDRITNHFDILPTFAAIVGGSPKETDNLHGRSLVPLMKDPNTKWDDRYRVFHKGRWAKDSDPEKAKLGAFAVRNQRFRMVGTKALYDMEKDPSQKTNVIDQHPEIAKKMLAHYEEWWKGARPNMVNEDARLEGHNTFKLMFWKQYDMEIPPVRQRPPRKPKKNRKKKEK